MQSIKNFNGEVGCGTNVSFKTDGLSKYEGMNEVQLLAELKKNVDTAKNDGSFSIERLDEFVEFASASLDEKSKERLVELVNMIKGYNG